jgi:hypothetical protein
MGQRSVDPNVAQRFAELVGLGLTQHEAARAVGIGASTGERLLTWRSQSAGGASATASPAISPA